MVGETLRRGPSKGTPDGLSPKMALSLLNLLAYGKFASIFKLGPLRGYPRF